MIKYRFSQDDVGKRLWIELEEDEYTNVTEGPFKCGRLLGVEIIGEKQPRLEYPRPNQVYLKDMSNQIFERDEDEIYIDATELLLDRIDENERRATMGIEHATQAAVRHRAVSAKYKAILDAMNARNAAV